MILERSMKPYPPVNFGIVDTSEASGGYNLLTNLISHWKLDEASGSALDAYGSNDLTDIGSVGSVAGKINNARDFSGTKYFTRGDNADLSIAGSVDFTFACWVKIDDKSSTRAILSKFSNAGNQRAYAIDYLASSDRFRFYVSSTGADSVIVTADTLGSPSTGTWYFIIAWHDATADTINIQVNNGTADSAAHSAGVYDNTAAFLLGARDGGSYLDGALDEISFWKGRILTAGEKTALWNGGAGVDFTNFGALGSSATGKVAMTWNNRNRLTSGIKKQTDASDALEAGQTQAIDIYKADGVTLLRSYSGLTGTSQDYFATQEVTDAGTLQSGLVIKVKSVRDSYESNQQSFVVTRP